MTARGIGIETNVEIVQYSACVWGVEHFVDGNTLVWVDHAKDWLSDDLKERLKAEAKQRKEEAEDVD